MAQALMTSVTGDAGLLGVGLLVTHVLKWQFRPQDLADVGIDAQIEPVLGGRPSGRLLGVQIKAGPSWFGEPTPAVDGWVFREETQTHRDYWLNYKLPVIVVLYDPEGHVAYWQHVTPETAVVTGKGFKIVIAALVLAYHTGITVEGARVVIPAIQTTAAEYGVDPMPYLRQHLIGMLTDPTDRCEMNAQQAAQTVDQALGEFA